VTFTRTTAAVNKYATGSLTWTATSGPDAGVTARSPFAVKPVAVAKSVHGTGTNGYANVSATLGVKTKAALHLSGLAKEVVLGQDNTISSNGTSGTFTAAHQYFQALRKVRAHSSYLKIVGNSLSGADGVDLDLYVLYRKTFTPNLNKWKVVSALPNASASESYSKSKPAAGYYYVELDAFAIPDAATVDYSVGVYNVTAGTAQGHFNASVASITSTKTSTNAFTVGWGGLDADSSYLGVIGYGTGSTRTIVNVDTGGFTHAVNITPPVITSTPTVGSKLTTTAGLWNIPTKYSSPPVEYLWLRNGSPIDGATKATHVVTVDDYGTHLSVQVVVHLDGDAESVVSATTVPVAAKTTTSVRISDSTIKHGDTATFFVTVTPNVPGANVADGHILIKWGSKASQRFESSSYGGPDFEYSVPNWKKGTYKVTASFLAGTTQAVSSAASKAKVLKVS
jgi:hypothetical protein